jgi:hypothetical protein
LPGLDCGGQGGDHLVYQGGSLGMFNASRLKDCL